MTRPTHQPFQWRALTSVLIAGAFLILALSGVLLFLSPPGRVANWTDWTLLGLTKTEWTSLHVSFSALFLITTSVHLFFNWRPLVSYFRGRLTRRIGWRREWAVALGICATLFLGARHGWPPVGQLMAWNEDFKQSWDDPASRAPIPHAELLTLKELSTQANLDLDEAIQRLQRAGARDFNEQTQLKVIAASLQRPPQYVYSLLIPADKPPSARTGLGWKTLSDYCAEQGMALREGLEALRAQGWQADPSQTLREIAEANNLGRPHLLIEVLNGSRPTSSQAQP